MAARTAPDLTLPGGRLRSERERLSLSLARMAKLAGLTQTELSVWEKSPWDTNARAFTAMANVGVDVLFVMTGKGMPERLAMPTIRHALDELPRDERHKFLLRIVAEEFAFLSKGQP